MFIVESCQSAGKCDGYYFYCAYGSIVFHMTGVENARLMAGDDDDHDHDCDHDFLSDKKRESKKMEVQCSGMVVKGDSIAVFSVSLTDC